ncbi:MAG: glycosyltransferase family 2 protein [Candidatus Dormiibacterota bacterium]
MDQGEPAEPTEQPGASAPPLTSLTLVLPVHNESQNLTWLLPHAATVLPSLARSWDLVIVDDGSTDGSGQLATDLAGRLGMRLRVLRHAQKSGYGITVGDGLRAATAEFVAFTDADGQFEIADLALLVPLLDRADLAAGWRRERQDARARELVSWVFNTLVAILYRLPYRDVDCAMKLMRREVLDSLTLEARSALINAELYYKARHAGWRIAQVPVPHHPRVAGRRSGARPRAIARAIKELVLFRFRIRRSLPARRLPRDASA